jgi:hypothetical protein
MAHALQILKCSEIANRNLDIGVQEYHYFWKNIHRERLGISGVKEKSHENTNLNARCTSPQLFVGFDAVNDHRCNAGSRRSRKRVGH